MQIWPTDLDKRAKNTQWGKGSSSINGVRKTIYPHAK